MLAQTISGVTYGKKQDADSFAACFDYFHRCFLWSDHSGVDGKKTNLTP